jgi:spermidine synthase
LKYTFQTLLHSVKAKIEVEKILEDFYSEFNHIEIIKTRSFGKMLLLDNEIQFTELDEFIYHEMFCFPSLFSHPHPTRILIIGGGDLLLARQVLKYPSIEVIDLIELDSYVIKFCKKHFKHLLRDTSSHPKLTVKIQDGNEYIKETSNSYDIIYIDLPDDKKNCKFAYEDEFYIDIKNILTPKGILSAQTGNGDYFYYSQRLKKIKKIVSQHNRKSSIEFYKIFNRHFKNICQYRQYIPSFFGSWSFTMGSEEIYLNRINFEKITQNYNQIKGNSFYYCPEFHQGIYLQPKIIENIMSCIRRT